MIERLTCTVMPYAWGSKTAIAGLCGRPPSDKPEAELWMGAHPMAPSKVGEQGLDQLVAAEPARMVGKASLEAFGPRLPFLMKVLAAAEPLSLQAHPSAAQAKQGFAEDEAKGIARDAPNRNYRDDQHKPELLCALTPFDALCGFREVKATLRLLDALDVAELAPLVAPLRASPDRNGLAQTFGAIMAKADAKLVERVVERAAKVGGEMALAPRLAALYPGDAGVVSALLLNQVHLAPGEAIFLDAGNLHAYLEGTGVEIMASSDNVLRGGLTKKHMDLPELVRVLDFVDGPVTPLRPDGEGVYRTPAREFLLSVVRPTEPVTFHPAGPEILLCTEGTAQIVSDGFTTVLEPGASAFVAASTPAFVVAGAKGGPTPTVYRATVNL